MKKFRGCLQGAVIGDCIGGIHDSSGSMHTYSQIAAKADPSSLKSKLVRAGDRHVFRFSGDSIAIQCASASILNHKNDLEDMKKSFQDCFMGSLKSRSSLKKAVSTSMILANLESDQERFDPTKFNLQGNCGVVRAIPCGLVDPDLAPIFAEATHSHSNATTGALILARMIAQLVNDNPDFTSITQSHANYHSKFAAVKSMTTDPNGELEESLGLQEKFLRKFGSNSSAIVAMSSGYFGFLRAVACYNSRESFEIPAYIKELQAKDRSKNLAGNSNRLDSSKALDRETVVIEEESPIAMAINWAISLGGDTRTNACIAGALAGTHWGDDHIPDEWRLYCEGTAEADDLAGRLYSSVKG